VSTTRPSGSGGSPVVAMNRPATPSRRVLVLGAGFIGAHIVRFLVQAGHEVDVITRSAPQPELAPYLEGARVVLGDVSSMAVVAGHLSEVDHVVYAVGSSSPIESDLDPAADVSAVVPPVVRLLELLRLRPSVGLTFLSSGGALYGNVVKTPVDEETLPEPISSYGILKLTAEKYLRMYADLYNIPITILRVANAYGPGQPWAKGQGIVARLMRCVLTGESFQVFGTGLNVRDYVYIDDVAQVVALLVTSHDGHRVLNVGSGKGYTILDLIGLVEQQTGRAINVEFKSARYFDVRSIVLDITRLSESLPYTPLDVPAGLGRTWHSIAQLDVEGIPALTPPQSPIVAT
jgi:UDP-glucose 4-epimerase